MFPTDSALEKLFYLAYRNIRKKRSMPQANWGTISQISNKIWREI
ncbi:hypothetical protein PGTDC60_0768 [Porphyromonas gingivalis TDC60]|nr:hypothetical protein PGTDC60_0768 [Porphyromonas gingivalis TDC60]